MDTSDHPHRSVEAAALNFLRAIPPSREKVHLIGHSYGGWLAIELAHLLATEGRPVASLTVIDSLPPRPYSEVASAVSDAKLLKQYVDAYERSTSSSIGIEAEFIRGSRVPEAWRAIEAAISQHQSGKNTADSRVNSLLCYMSAARLAYSPLWTYQGPMSFVRAAAETSDGELGQKIGEWRRIAPAAEEFALPGTHHTILRGSNALALANWWTHQRDQ